MLPAIGWVAVASAQLLWPFVLADISALTRNRLCCCRSCANSCTGDTAAR